MLDCHIHHRLVKRSCRRFRAMPLNWVQIILISSGTPTLWHGFTATDIFDSNYLFLAAPANVESPKTSNFSRFISRLPPLDDDEDFEEDDRVENVSKGSEPWSITESSYEKLCLEVQNYSAVIPAGCSLPSRSAMSRYLETYFSVSTNSIYLNTLQNNNHHRNKPFFENSTGFVRCSQ